jgi:hypothetical protein
MQKVYLLLRNNQQTGPHSFEELLHLQLKPNDLVWIEGKSYGWRYPAEVESLKPYMPIVDFKVESEQTPPKNTEANKTSTASPKKIFVSMPVTPRENSKENIASIDVIEQKEEELRKRAQAYTPQQEEVKINYSRNINEAEQDYANWMYKTKTKKKSKLPGKTLVIASVVALIVLAGWWMKGQFFDQTSTVTESTAQDKKISEIQEITTPVDPIENEQITSAEKIKPKVEKTGKEKTPNTDEVVAQKETTENETVSITDEQVINQPPVTDNKGDNTKTLVQAPVEKKKTLKEKISNLFKKKNEAGTEEETKATENTDNERKATRRADDDATTSVTDISDQVEIKTNKIADSWMMGVKNVKLTLYNRSNLTLNIAKAEVLYYSDQNTLLEKKIISFVNIPANKSQTLSIPDNRLADHIDYKVASATGVENAYANR